MFRHIHSRSFVLFEGDVQNHATKTNSTNAAVSSTINTFYKENAFYGPPTFSTERTHSMVREHTGIPYFLSGDVRSHGAASSALAFYTPPSSPGGGGPRGSGRVGGRKREGGRPRGGGV